MQAVIEQKFFNQSKAAMIVGRSPRTLRNWVAKGYLPKKKGYSIEELNLALFAAANNEQEAA
jgi:hypothetical protein